MLMITRQLQIDFHLFNLGVARAREEYAWHPFAWSCGSYCVCPWRRRLR